MRLYQEPATSTNCRRLRAYPYCGLSRACRGQHGMDVRYCQCTSIAAGERPYVGVLAPTYKHCLGGGHRPSRKRADLQWCVRAPVGDQQCRSDAAALTGCGRLVVRLLAAPAAVGSETSAKCGGQWIYNVLRNVSLLPEMGAGRALKLGRLLTAYQTGSIGSRQYSIPK
jgi:hypothetical protein